MQEQYATPFQRFLNGFFNWSGSLQAFDYLLILAFLLAAVAVFLFLRADRTERWRLHKEFRQRAAQRDFALRRDVYLPAAEAIARAQDCIGRFPDQEQDQAQDVMDQVTGALGKAQLVAAEDCGRAIVALTTELTSSHLELTARRQSLAAVNGKIEDLDREIEHLALERDRLLNHLTRLAGDRNPERVHLWKDMNRQFDKLHRDIGTRLGQRKDKRAQRESLTQEFEVARAQRALRLIKLGVPAYLALRDELRLTTDEAEYRACAQRGIAEVERELRALTKSAIGKQAAGGKTITTAGRREPVIPPAAAQVALKRSG